MTGVVLGAYGAHGLARDAASVSSWGTAVDYQLIHAVVLMILGLWYQQIGSAAEGALSKLKIAGYFLLIGVLLFSGSIYLLVLGGPAILGPVTPVGGTLLIVGWLIIVWAAFTGHHDH